MTSSVADSPESFRASRGEGEHLSYVSELLLGDHLFDAALQNMSREISRITSFPVVTVQLYDAERQKMFYKGTWGVPAVGKQAVELSVEVSPYGKAVREGRPVVAMGGIRADDAVFGWLTPKTLVCVPIKADNKIIGTLSLGHPDVVQIDDNQFSYVTGLANLLAVFIERKYAEKTMREAERFLQAALDALSSHVSILDGDGRIIAVNRAWRGFADDNAYVGSNYGVGTSYLAVCEADPDAREVGRGILDVILGRRDECFIEYPCHSPDQKRWFTMRATRFEWAGLVRVVVAHQDVTPYKLAVEELGESEKRTRAIVDHVVDGIVTLDEIGRIEAINPAGAQMFGCQPAEVLGKNLDQLIPYATPGVLRQWAGERSAQQQELTGRRTDGATFPVYLAVSEVRLGKRRLFTAIVQDLTERKRAEAERLERERLRVALEKEKELREVKTRFVSTLSHELRTPLAAIRLAGDMLLKFGDRATPDERLEYLDTILTQTGYLTDMVSDILHLSQTETIGLDFNPKPTSMEVFCRRVVKDMEAVSRGSHDLSFISRQRPVYAMVDEKLLYHALTNLLTNAMKYSPEGSEVRLELSRKLNTIRIRVTDYGIGIPENDQERLFEPFHRAGNVNGVNGTGLGLYIARQAVEAHKGKITVESRIGTGTTFSVFLPV